MKTFQADRKSMIIIIIRFSAANVEARILRVLVGKRNPMETAPLDMNSSVTDVDIHSLSTIVKVLSFIQRMKKKRNSCSGETPSR